MQRNYRSVLKGVSKLNKPISSSNHGQKQNNKMDSVYLIQNENQIIRSKNMQVNSKINALKLQILQHNQQLTQLDRDCQALKNTIHNVRFTQEIKLNNEKKSITEKISITEGNYEILHRKIQQVREATVYQEQKIHELKTNKISFEKEMWHLRTQNQGTKIILENLQKQNEKIRSQNENMVSKRKRYEPKQRQISQQIEERIRYIKSIKSSTNEMKKIEVSKLLIILLENKQNKRKKEIIMIIEKYALKRKIKMKRLFMLSLIRKKYIRFIQNLILQKFRSNFKPLKQYQKAKRIIKATQQRRIKNKLWRIWRSETSKAWFSMVRKFQIYNMLQKLQKSFEKTIIINSFNNLKYFHLNLFHQQGCLKIHHIFNIGSRRSKNMFFRLLRNRQKTYTLQLEQQAGKKQQKILLILGLYFGSWSKLVKTNKLSNTIIKFKSFQNLKKLKAIKNAQILSQMLAISTNKINNIDTYSKIFNQIKRKTIISKIEELTEEKIDFRNRINALKQSIKQKQLQNKDRYQKFSLFKIFKLLKKQTQTAFNFWRRTNRQTKYIKAVLNTLVTKQKFAINYAFACLQAKRFEKLKKSIAQKIQGCQFSYNYLLEQNKHIKQVLDTKTLELERSKFVSILRRVTRQQKQIKSKYWFAFLKNGYKYWKVRKTCDHINKMIEKKSQMVFLFLIKYQNKQILDDEKLESKINLKQLKIENKLYRKYWGGLKSLMQRNKRLKRVLSGIFNRNLQLNVWAAYGKIKSQYLSYEFFLIEKQESEVIQRCKKTDLISKQEQELINTLRDRLKKKQQIFKQRKIMALYKFFSKNIKINYSKYIIRWKQKVRYEKNVMQFAVLLDRKTQIIVKNKFMLALIKNEKQTQINQLKQRVKKFQKDYQLMNQNHSKFTVEIQQKSMKMMEQNKFHINEVGRLEKKTNHMDDIKINSFIKTWRKKLCLFALRQWKKQKQLFIIKWDRLYQIFNYIFRKEPFNIISKGIKQEQKLQQIKHNLSQIHVKMYRYNCKLALRIWQLVNLRKKYSEYQDELNRATKGIEKIEQKYYSGANKHFSYVDYRVRDVKLRRIISFMKKYTLKRVAVHRKKEHLEEWLIKGYESQLITLFKKMTQFPIQQRHKLAKHLAQKKKSMKKKIIDEIYLRIFQREKIRKLFMQKFIFHLKYNLNQQFLMRIKNYYRNKDNKQLTRNTVKIQKIIECFEKKRKYILATNIRIWRRNQYQMNISKILMKRLTRNATNKRTRDLFYAWKLQKQAKMVQMNHREQGEIKKRKIEVQRINTFLQDFKKQKGLLLQNEEGNFVMSPKFQQRKDKQAKRDNNLRYKFIARLILSLNNYQAPIKAWNNLILYTQVKKKYQKGAQFVRNKLKRPQLHYAFQIWKKAASEFREIFDTMQRKKLIKILLRQKQKMEIQYTKKLRVEDVIKNQISKYKYLSHQSDKREKLCAQVLMRNARKVKLYALRTWRENTREIRQYEGVQLEKKGEIKIITIENQIEQLEETQKQIKQQNYKLQQAVKQALEIAELVKKITEERNTLSQIIIEKGLSCQSLQEQNQELNAKLYLAQKEAMNLLILSGQNP